MDALYKCYSEMNEEEYVKMIPYFPAIYWNHVFSATYIPCVLTIAILANNQLVSWEPMMCFAINVIIYLTAMRLALKHRCRVSYRRMEQRCPGDRVFLNEFYEEYFIFRGEHVIRKTEYSKIKKVIETQSHMYLYDGIRTFVFQKEKCEKELIEFMRNITPTRIERTSNEELHKEQSREQLVNYTYHEVETNGVRPRKPDRTQLLLDVLFVANFIALASPMPIIAKFAAEATMINMTDYMWIFWLFLMIPVLSVILGFVYERKGYECTKNIVAGVIVGFICLIFGSFSVVFPKVQTEYEQIYEYNEYLDVELPKEGHLYIMEWDSYMNGMDGMTEISAKYSNEDCELIKKQIEQNSKWRRREEINSLLEIFVPPSVASHTSTYVSIYNITDNTYNETPKKAGRNELCIMVFNEELHSLGIYYYDYLYKE